VEEDFFPQPNWILDAIHERIVPLDGHQLTTNPTNGELVRRNRDGV
jgi:2-oxoisovalerate dehydrogenase E1 component